MKSSKQYLFLSIIGILFSAVYSRSIVKQDDYCIIFINNTYALTSGNAKYQKRQEPEQFVSTLLEEINELIIENKDTYQNPEVLEDKNSLRKRSDDDDLDYVSHISTIDDYSIAYAYLSYSLNEKIKKMDGIINCRPEEKVKVLNLNDLHKIDAKEYHGRRHSKRSDKKNLNSFINDIKEETGWKGVEVRQDVLSNLSLLSQGFYNDTKTIYDTNYYYPKSAGKDIDVYIIDSGFNFRDSAFSNKSERTAKCIGYIKKYSDFTKIDTDYCVSNIFTEKIVGDHGEFTSNIIGGIKEGVASKANIYGFSLHCDDTLVGESLLYETFEYFATLKYRPNKSIINLSLAFYSSIANIELTKLTKKYLDVVVNKGVIIVSSAGNGVNYYEFGEPVIGEDYMILPCVFDNVICVGGIDNYGRDKKRYDSKEMITANYRKWSVSNYGKEVDIYAPVTGEYAMKNKNNKLEYRRFQGTSLSTALVSGVIATIMGEHTDTKFDIKSMKAYLKKIGLNNVISGIPEGPNLFINNGKHLVYGDDSTNVHNVDDSIDLPDEIDSESESDNEEEEQ